MSTELAANRTRTAYSVLDDAFEKAGLGMHAHFLNWGYESVSGLVNEAPEGLVRPGPNEASERLVAELLGPVCLDGMRVADIGCGRGGTLDIVTDRFRPLSATGIDLSPDNIAGARQLLASRRVRLQVADACTPPLATSSQDVVLNLESSGAYPDMCEFLRHVHRILSPDGLFLFGDLWPTDLIPPFLEIMKGLGFELEALRDVTRQVCRARDRMPARLMSRLAGTAGVEDVKDYFAAPGSAMYECLDGGKITYIIGRWRRKEGGKPELDTAVLEARAARIEELLSQARTVLEPRAKWFPFGGPRRGAEVNILAFPHAIAGASAFKSWTGVFPSEWQFSPVQLPGREGRISESPFTVLGEAVDALLPLVYPYTKTPLILVGWSLGSKIAFELANRLEQEGVCQPLLVVTGVCPGPHEPLPDLRSFFGDDSVENRLRVLGGTPDSILASDEMLSALKTTMEGDTAMAASYRSEASIQAPIMALSARHDELVSESAVESWRPRTVNGFTHHRLDGGHFMVRDAGMEVAKVVRDAVALELAQAHLAAEVA